MAIKFWVPATGDVNLVPAWPVAGPPTNGTSGSLAGLAQPGDFYVDTTNLVTYQNTGTSASPTWGAFASAAAVSNGTLVGSFTFVGGSYAGGLAAVGTSRTNALALTAQINLVATAASSAVGVILPASAGIPIGAAVRVLNDGPANAFNVYAAGSDTIDTIAGATGVVLTNAFYCDYLKTAAATFKSYCAAIVRSA